MAVFLLEMFGVSLALTLVIELTVGYWMGMRGKNQILLLILLNILTNPAAVLLHWLGAAQLPVEIGVVMAETVVFWVFSKDARWKIPHPIRLALICNTISWVFGILIQRIGG